MTFAPPPLARLRWRQQHRVIATRYPPVDLFERLDIPEAKKRALWALQVRVNPRLLQATGDLRLVRAADMVSGPNASIVMASFTHTGFPSRFSDGAFGVYYASRELETAIRETVFHRERDARERQLSAQEFDMRAYVGQVKKPMYDIRGKGHSHLQDPDPASYSVAQGFAKALLDHDPDAWGLVFRSVRHAQGMCIAALRPPAISLPVSGAHLTYVWDGARIVSVYEKSDPIMVF